MRVFVAGASGVVGRSLVPQLVAAGHEVTAMASSEPGRARLEGTRAQTVACDVFDADRLVEVVTAARPDVVVHQLTRLPAVINPRRLREAYEPNDRVRREGTRNLVAAARAAGARRVIAQSIAFAYAPSGPPVVDEDHPLADGAPGVWGESIAALRALEETVLGAAADGGPDGVVLRYGFFYGPGTAFAPDGQRGEEVQRRRFPIVGRGDGVFSFIHVEDAAAASVAALEGGSPGAYNVTDDEPAPAREWLPEYAAALGAPPPRRVPAFLARLVAGTFTATMATQLRGASNERFKRAFGWEPRHASWRTGFHEALG